MNKINIKSIKDLKSAQKSMRSECKKMEKEAIHSFLNPKSMLANLFSDNSTATNAKQFGIKSSATLNTSGLVMQLALQLLPLLPIKPILGSVGKLVLRNFIKVQTVNLGMKLLKGLLNKRKTPSQTIIPKKK